MSDNKHPLSDLGFIPEQKEESHPLSGLGFVPESQSPKMEIGSLESLGLGAVQGASLGFADEIEAALKSGTITGPEYEAAKEIARKKYKEAEEQHPYMYGGGQLGGGLGSVLIPGVGGLGASLKGAAALGATTAIGQQEAPISDVGTTAKNLAIGGTAGVGGYALGKGISSILAKKAAAASGSLQGAAEELAGKSVGLKKAQVLKEIGGKNKYISGPDTAPERVLAKEALEHIRPFQSADELASSTSSKYQKISDEVKNLVEQADEGIKAKLGPVDSFSPDKEAFTALGTAAPQKIAGKEAKLGLSSLGDEVESILNSVSESLPKGGSASRVKGLRDSLEPVIDNIRLNDGSIKGLMEAKDEIRKNLTDANWLKSNVDSPENIALLKEFYKRINNRLEELGNIVSPDLGTTIRKHNMTLSNILSVGSAAAEKEAGLLTKQGVSTGDYLFGSVGAGLGGAIGGAPGAIVGTGLGMGVKKGIETYAGQELPDIARAASAKGFEKLGKMAGSVAEKAKAPSGHLPFTKASTSVAASKLADRDGASSQITSHALYSMDNTGLQQISSRMKQAGIRPDVSDKLDKALASGDSAQKNSVLFIIAQDPKLREALRIK